MTSGILRILFLADTHLGFDLPFRPRVERRRRGPDFFRCYHQALKPAYTGDVDLVVHGGDLFFRSRVPEKLIEMAMRPLVEVAELGVPVYLVPGNHERSKIPLRLWGTHRNLHIFNRPKTFVFQNGNKKLALSGFPFTRNVQGQFVDLVEATGYRQVSVHMKLLCIHQAVEGAVVGVQNYTFRGGVDVVRGCDICADFTAVLSGHIHRAQVLADDLGGNSLAAPVIYPGSTERTSFAERDEEKGYMILEMDCSNPERTIDHGIKFVNLPARPMANLVIDASGYDADALLDLIRLRLAELDPESVVRIQLVGDEILEIEPALSVSILRSIAPATMNVTLAGSRYPQNM